jgi:hypothetical protein
MVNILDLFYWHQIQVLVLMTGGFIVSLTLLGVGILSSVEGAVPLVHQLRGELARVCFSPVFLGLMVHLVLVEPLKWYLQQAGL